MAALLHDRLYLLASGFAQDGERGRMGRDGELMGRDQWFEVYGVELDLSSTHIIGFIHFIS